MADREARHIDVPALSGVVGLCEGTTLGLITDCKYGYRLAENVLPVTLIHTAGDPDPYPERGIHAIELFVTLTDGTHVDMKNRASWLIQPMTAVPTGWHKGVAPEIDSLLDVQAEHSVLTSIQKNDKGELYLRFYEAEGREEMLRIQLPFGAKSAVVTKLDGTPIGEATV